MTAIRALLVLLLAALAQPAVAQGINVKEDAARINVRLGLEYMRQGQLAIAQEKIDKALQQDPRNASVQLGAGLLYEALREPKRAEKHFREAVRLEPRNPEAQNALGAFLCRNGQSRKGETAFLEAANNPIYRTPEVALTNAAVCARKDGRLDKSEEYLRLALARRATYTEALVQMAGVSFERGSLMQARAFLERYLAAAPATADVLLLGYQIESGLGDAAAAARYADRLRTSHAASPETRVVEELARKDAP
ncbi:MAG: type IV pilus biogenesis/stability protein PilW [Steroidobacteraceae bacterium]|nr:type IV pilus biogenesis/stability protein PilW [Steroidobacteraceae bacterium]